MNKYIYILLAVFALTSFASCGGSDDDYIPSTEPDKGDNITVQDVVGTYHPNSAYFENSKDIATYDRDHKITFNSDYTGSDFTYNGDRVPFTWSLNNNVISFTHSKYGAIKAWMKDGSLSFKMEYGTNSIIVYVCKKIN